MLCDTVNPVTVAPVKLTAVFVRSTSTPLTNSTVLDELPITTLPPRLPSTSCPVPVERIIIPLLPPCNVNTLNVSDIEDPPLPVISLLFKSKLPPSCGVVSSTTFKIPVLLIVLKSTVLPPLIVKLSPASVSV